MHIDVTVDEAEYERVHALAEAAGLSVEEWIHTLIQSAAQAPDPLFGILADEPELTAAIDEVVAERRRLAALV